MSSNLPVKYDNTSHVLVKHGKKTIRYGRYWSMRFVRYLAKQCKSVLILIKKKINRIASNAWHKISETGHSYHFYWQDFFAYGWLIILLGLLLIMPLVGLHHHLQPYPNYENLMPSIFNDGSHIFPLGTDGLGRDRLARLIASMQNSFTIAIIATIFAGIIGSILGVISGLYGGVFNRVISYLANIINVLPALMIVLVFIHSGQHHFAIITAIILIQWRHFFYPLRDYIATQSNKPYINYAILFHSPRKWAMFRKQLLPNCKALFIHRWFISFNLALILDTITSFLLPVTDNGLVRAGHILLENNMVARDNSWLAFLPFILLLFTCLALHRLGKRKLQMRYRHG